MLLLSKFLVINHRDKQFIYSLFYLQVICEPPFKIRRVSMFFSKHLYFFGWNLSLQAWLQCCYDYYLDIIIKVGLNLKQLLSILLKRTFLGQAESHDHTFKVLGPIFEETNISALSHGSPTESGDFIVLLVLPLYWKILITSSLAKSSTANPSD